MQISLIWAQARGGAIGKGNTLPWHLPEDLAHFKAQTQGAPVIMGRKTFESLPNGALPNRLNIVVSRTTPEAEVSPASRWVQSLEGALDLASKTHLPKAFVIGGAQLYRLSLEHARQLHITEIDLEVSEADAFAPAVPEDLFELTAGPWLTSRTGLRYRFIEGHRR